MAWLFAFILSPRRRASSGRCRPLPRGRRGGLVYALLFLALSAVMRRRRGAAATSIVQTSSTSCRPSRSGCPRSSAVAAAARRPRHPGRPAWPVANDALAGIGEPRRGPSSGRSSDLALASLGIVGNLLLIVFLSLFIVIDKDSILAFFNRLAPPRYAEEVRLFQTSVVSSFGGFIRGQAIQGVVYGAFAAVGSLALGSTSCPLTTALVAVLQIDPVLRAVRVLGAAGGRRRC